MFTVLLLIIAFVVVGILVGARASEQHRQVGLLKAVGFTPRQVGIVFALESVALGAVAAALGFALGAVLRRALPRPAPRRSSARQRWRRIRRHILVARCVVLPVLFAGAVTSTRRSTRFTASRRSVRARCRPPIRGSRTWGSIRAPLTAGLGFDDLLHEGAALLLTAAIALTGAVGVTALSLDATLDAQRPRKPVTSRTSCCS